MHGAKLSKKITKYCLRDAILRPILFAGLAVRDNTKQLLILCSNLIDQKRSSEEEDVHGDVCIWNEDETDFKNFDILRETKSKISKKN